MLVPEPPPERPSPLLIALATGLTGAAIVWACTTEVTMPLAWPTGTTLLAAGLLADKAHRRQQRASTEHATRQHIDLESMTVIKALNGPDNERIGIVERHAILDRLADRYSTGHLDETELDQRQQAALQAVTRKDLAYILRDLP